MKPSISDEELGRLTAEVLPERTAMSMLVMPFGHGAQPVDDGQGTTVAYACQTTYRAGTPGLLGTGLGATPATTTTSCVPAAIVSH